MIKEGSELGIFGKNGFLIYIMKHFKQFSKSVYVCVWC